MTDIEKLPNVGDIVGVVTKRKIITRVVRKVEPNGVVVQDREGHIREFDPGKIVQAPVPIAPEYIHMSTVLISRNAQ